MPEPLSRWLSVSTAELHRDLEADLLPDGRIAGFSDVLRLVTVHARVLDRYAGSLDAAQTVPVTGPLSRWRVAAEADLASWGAGSSGAEQGIVGRRERESDPEFGTAELVGVRYVLEGARVGLRVLAPEVAATVRTAGLPASAFFVPDPDAGERWRAVRAWLDSAQNFPADRHDVLRGAWVAFEAYRSR